MLESFRLWSLLWRQTEGKVSKAQFMDFTDFDLVNVLYRPGVHDGSPAERGLPYWPVPVSGKEDEGGKGLTFQEMYVAHWTQHGGLTEEEALQKFAVWFKGYDGPAFTPEEPPAQGVIKHGQGQGGDRDPAEVRGGRPGEDQGLLR